MERISISNFGPITKAEIEVKDINIFIGTTSSGKSTVAKLIAIFKSILHIPNPTYTYFIKLLADYNIDFIIGNETELIYVLDKMEIKVKRESLAANTSVKSLDSKINSIYIPAERMFFSTISQSIFGLINSDVSLPKWLIDFGAKFEQSRNSIKKFSIKFLNAEYAYEDSTDYIQTGGDTKIKLSQASSGLQSVIPLILVVQFNTEGNKEVEDIFVIEEPELNLYPSSQKELIEFIVQKINESGRDKLIVTTHSPYLLTAIDNLIQAKNAVALQPAAEKEITKLVPSSSWIDYGRVACYYFDKGTCISTMDDEMKSIGPSSIDDVSVGLSDTFEKLLMLKYHA